LGTSKSLADIGFKQTFNPATVKGSRVLFCVGELMEFKRPQLCQVYKGTEDIQNWYAEPKINGNRGLIFIHNKSVEVLSRNNKPIYNTELIQEVILSSGLNQCVLDGEFYIPGDTTNNTDWSNTTSVLRTQTKHTEKDKLCFFVFDIIPLAFWGSEYTQSLCSRKTALRKTLEKIDPRFVKFVEHVIVKNHSDVAICLDTYLMQGFEGTVIKNPASVYTYKRSSSWLKVKKIVTDEYPIVNVLRGKGKYSKTTGSILISVNGVIVGVGTGMTDNDRNLIWSERDELIGIYLEVSYQTKSKDGSLIFPVFQRIRYDLI